MRRPYAGGCHPDSLCNLRLGSPQKGAKLHAVDAILAVVIVRVAAAPAHAPVSRRRFRRRARRRRLARMAGQRRADQAFEAAFGGVGGHMRRSPENDDCSNANLCIYCASSVFTSTSGD